MRWQWTCGGAVVLHTRGATLPATIVPKLERATQSVGRDFKNFFWADITCGPEPPLVERSEKTAQEGEKTIITEVEQLEEQVEKVGKTEMSFFYKLAEGLKELQKDEHYFPQELRERWNDLKMEANEVEKLFG